MCAGTPQEQLATCDAIKPQERSLWEAQDILAGALPQALSEAFQTVEHDYLQTSKVCVSLYHPPVNDITAVVGTLVMLRVRMP